MIKLETKIALITLPLMLVALATLTWVIFGKNLNETIALIVVIICIIGIIAIIATLNFWQIKTDRLGVRKIIELKSKGKINNKATRNITKIISFALMAGVIFFITYNQISTFYVFIYVAINIVLNITFLTPKKLVIDNNAIHCFPNWKIKWAELKTYQLVKTEGILIMEKVNGKTIQVSKIEEEDIEVIETMIKKYHDEKAN